MSFIGFFSRVRMFFSMCEDIDFQASPAVFGVCVFSCMLVCFVGLFSYAWVSFHMRGSLFICVGLFSRCLIICVGRYRFSGLSRGVWNMCLVMHVGMFYGTLFLCVSFFCRSLFICVV